MDTLISTNQSSATDVTSGPGFVATYAPILHTIETIKMRTLLSLYVSFSFSCLHSPTIRSPFSRPIRSVPSIEVRLRSSSSFANASQLTLFFLPSNTFIIHDETQEYDLSALRRASCSSTQEKSSPNRSSIFITSLSC